MNRCIGARAMTWLALVLGLATVAPSLAQWEIKNAEGTSSFKIGFLAVMRADSEELTNGDTAQNIYFRRLRILGGGKLADKWTYFFETDSPNLGKSDATGAKNAGDIYIQDFFVTYEQNAAFKIDFGMILIPLSHNSTQSAATHLASDYGPYSFLESGPTKSRVGRDYGAQIRGAVADNKFEYRFGIYDGDRGVNSTESFRYAGRVAYSFIGTETGMFYTGNNLGAKKQLTVGAGFDVQDDYQAIGYDFFWDQPMGDKGGAITLQADDILYDGGKFFSSLPKQNTYMVEFGYLFPGGKWQPWLQYADRNFSNAALHDETQTWIGMNYRMAKHNRVVRAAYGQIDTDGASSRGVFQLTLQIFQF
ncbi:MAG: porin [Thermoanaerobaculia bacterium]